MKKLTKKGGIRKEGVSRATFYVRNDDSTEQMLSELRQHLGCGTK